MNTLKISGFNIVSNEKIIISGSKSESNRVLILKYLFNSNIIINNLSTSDDTKVLLKALENQTDIIDIHHAGTAMRFLTSFYAVTNKKNREQLAEYLNSEEIDFLNTHSDGWMNNYLDNWGIIDE